MPENSNSNSRDIVSFADVRKVYEPQKITALHDVTFHIAQGEFVVLVGPSGEGKSTILKIIANIEKESSGKVARPDRVAMSFQSAALFPWLSVFENVALGLRTQRMGEKELHTRVEKYIEMMHLKALTEKRPPELSGGQAQRVGIARALAVEPEVLLLDEPFSALDAKTTAELHDDLIKIWQSTHKTIIMVSHIIEEAVSLADRVLLVKKGAVVSEFPVTLPYPRREQGAEFMHDVQKIRREFFR